ncbi:hypothetical protein QJS04_geneDACA011726 [Acorus gramineus]|uniref:Uncharacterized protein n=1 Tax=Acorus gramineus TaxID=55184 RepID=A0AAV9BEU2_ACOGR|nr:hypothetical protein QJS04_geneDACA011726 [Acorus gramineus]
MIFGSIPASIGRLSLLSQLYLSQNQLNGTISKNIGQLSELKVLDVAQNALQDTIFEHHFANLVKLEQLDMSSNSLVLNVSSEWVPPFHLKIIGLGSCRLGGHFPHWLYTQNNFDALNLSNTGISDTIPDWFWNLSSQATLLDLSQNEIRGMLPMNFASSNISDINLSSNLFEGPLPPLPSNIQSLDLTNNSFTGPIVFGNDEAKLNHLFLSNNQINGSIPSFICKFGDQLAVLDLSNNQLSGELPICWNNLTMLMVVNLANNNLSVDLGQNNLHGNVPTWLGESLSSLLFLRLRSNSFSGAIPPQICNLSSLQILDLANNYLTGHIPECIGNFSNMVINPNASQQALHVMEYVIDYKYSLPLVKNGMEREYTNNLPLVTNMDLSSNSLVGEIPESLLRLLGLQSLNLSENHLTGNIPSKIGDLRSMISLDLSRNELSGQIPPSLSDLNFLGYLNLSFNNLSGRIPTGNQLQTLNDASIYMGNFNLCGPPISQECTDDGPSQSPSFTSEDNKDEAGDSQEMLWLFLGIAPGFVLGFWMVWGILLFKRNWRIAYFLRLDNLFM